MGGRWRRIPRLLFNQLIFKSGSLVGGENLQGAYVLFIERQEKPTLNINVTLSEPMMDLSVPTPSPLQLPHFYSHLQHQGWKSWWFLRWWVVSRMVRMMNFHNPPPLNRFIWLSISQWKQNLQNLSIFAKEHLQESSLWEVVHWWLRAQTHTTDCLGSSPICVVTLLCDLRQVTWPFCASISSLWSQHNNITHCIG